MPCGAPASVARHAPLRLPGALAATATYPGAGDNLVYPTLGLAGEAGEVAEKVKKMLRDDGGVMTGERLEALAGELGDVLWYVAQVATEAGLDLDEIAAGQPGQAPLAPAARRAVGVGRPALAGRIGLQTASPRAAEPAPAARTSLGEPFVPPATRADGPDAYLPAPLTAKRA